MLVSSYNTKMIPELEKRRKDKHKARLYFVPELEQPRIRENTRFLERQETIERKFRHEPKVIVRKISVWVEEDT